MFEDFFGLIFVYLPPFSVGFLVFLLLYSSAFYKKIRSENKSPKKIAALTTIIILSAVTALLTLVVYGLAIFAIAVKYGEGIRM